MSADQLQPPRPSETYGRQPVEGEGRLRRLAASPFFIVSVVVAGFLLLGVLLLVALQFQSAPPLVVPGAQRAAMADGSILWLKVTSGTQHDFVFEHPEHDALERIFDPTESKHLSAHTDENRFVIWLMRQDPVTGRPLDFDWWSHSSVIDEHGREIVDDNPYRESYYRYGMRGEGGSRPFSPLEPQEYNGIVVRSELPVFRHGSGTFTLRLHNTEGDVAARFEVPHSLPFQPPTWVPEELPVTKSRDGLAVTLREVEFEKREYHVNGQKRSTLLVRPSFDVAFGDMPTNVWQVNSMQLSDPLGNTAWTWECDLDPREAAWRLPVQAARTVEAEFSPDEVWQLPWLQIPEANNLQSLRLQDDPRIHLLYFGGPGKTTYQGVNPQRQSGGGSSSGFLPTADGEQSEYRIEVDYEGPTKTISVDAPLPYFAFESKGRDSDQALLVRGTSESGEKFPAHVQEFADLVIAFLEVPPDKEQVALEVILHRTYELEFFIQPPRDDSAGTDN